MCMYRSRLTAITRNACTGKCIVSHIVVTRITQFQLTRNLFVVVLSQDADTRSTLAEMSWYLAAFCTVSHLYSRQLAALSVGIS